MKFLSSYQKYVTTLMMAGFLSGCGYAATYSLAKAECESRGLYWDSVQGCMEQATTTDTATAGTSTDTGTPDTATTTTADTAPAG